MNLKAHYAMTVSALFFLGLMLTRPEVFHKYSLDKRDCRLIKGRVSCTLNYTEYRINDVRSEVEYRFE